MTRRRGYWNGEYDHKGTDHGPNAIDDYTGFKVPLSSLKKDWKGLLAVDPEKRNPQDFVRGVRDNQALPYSRPEAPDTFIDGPFLTETEDWIYAEFGIPILGENSVTFDEALRELVLVENDNYFILEDGEDMLPEYVVTP
jgi:hypothetical protein